MITITEYVLMAFAVLFTIALVLLIREAHRSEARRLEIASLKFKSGRQTADAAKRINELEEALSDSTVKILNLQQELTESEDKRNELLNRNAELASGLNEETNDCRDIEGRNRQLNEELTRAIEIINDLVDRNGVIRESIETIRKNLDHPYQHFAPNEFPQPINLTGLEIQITT